MLNSLDTDKPEALIKFKLEFGSVGFCGRRKIGEPGEKPSEQGKNQQQTQSTRTGMETKSERWEVSTYPLHHLYSLDNKCNQGVF